jgi:tetratricopeptide (TPR) repeat protein
VIEVWALYTRIFDPSPDVVTTARSMVEHFSGIGDHWVQVWPGAFLGNLAESTGDFVEARREFERVLGVGREISYGRISEYMLNSLGRVTIRQGDYGEAMGYLTESIAVSMDLGQMREVLGSIVDVARVRIGEQRETEAVTLLAVVLNDPRSAQRTVFGTASIEDLAQELRVELEASLPPADYDAAWQRGMTMTADDAVELALTS